MDYLKQAHFLYDDSSKHLIEDIVSNKFNTKITPLHVDEFLDGFAEFETLKHIVICAQSSKIYKVMNLAHKYSISVGIIPLATQKDIIKNMYCSSNMDENIEIALRDNSKYIDVIQVGSKFVYLNGIVGTMPLIDKGLGSEKKFLKTIWSGLKQFFSIKLQKFEITTHNQKTIVTAGSAVIVLNNSNSSLISKIFDFEQSMCDGEVTAVIVSPFSIFEYLKLILLFAFGVKDHKTLPESIGYIKSKSIEIKASKSKNIIFEDAKEIKLPVKCEVIKDAIKINASDKFWENNKRLNPTKETIKTSKLPDANESVKYISHHIPLFKFASEERFKDLFQILRADAKINPTYLMLMILSTLLATVGLFANSSAVIIGAMLVAPLMVPIISLSMGLLRGDTNMAQDSMLKIALGVVLALLASSSLAYLLPYSEITQEMNSRINPTLLDLAIAILSGIAAAYSKSFKEIISNLAGVAIAVALVPPLAVAGIGLGYGNLSVFGGAFLLFFTNLVGIIIAAVMTFWILGFSSVLKSKKSIIFIIATIIAISYPLHVSYDKILQRYKIATMLKQHRFIVHNKYIIINDAKIAFHKDIKILKIKLLVREALDKADLLELKQDIQRLFNAKLFIEIQVEYIL